VWLYWDGRRWARDIGNLHAMRCAEGTARSIYAEAAELAKQAAETQDEEQREKLNERATALLAWAKKSATVNCLDDMMRLAENKPGMHAAPTEFDANPYLLNVENGMLDLKTLSLTAHDPEERCTKICAAAFDQKASSEEWNAVLAAITSGDTQLQHYLQRVAGYCATGSVAERKCWYVFGPTSCGKTTYIWILASVLGEYAADTKTELLLKQDSTRTIREDVAALLGVRLAVGSELDRGRALDIGEFKKLVDNAPLTAERKYGHQFSFTPTAKLVFTVNDLPLITRIDPAVFARLRVVPFRHRYSGKECDSRFRERFLANPNNRAAVLKWIAEGARDYIRHGLDSEPACVREATEAYRLESDWLSPWYEERCEADVNASAEMTALYEDFLLWTRQQQQLPAEDRAAKVLRSATTQNEFADALTDYGHAAFKHSRTRRAMRKEIRLRPRVVDLERSAQQEPKRAGAVN
jgi:putative DNA primase/helicase